MRAPIGLNPKVSDGGDETRRLAAAVRCSAWLGDFKWFY